MDERRRRLLATLGATGAAALAGCTGGGDTGSSPGDAGSPPDDTATTPTATLTATRGSGGGSRSTGQAGVLAPGDEGDEFGYRVAVSSDGSTAVVTAPYDEGPDGDEVGSAFVFARSGDGWTRQATLAPDDGGPLDLFGYAVATSADGSTVVVGAVSHGSAGAVKAGAAYVFERSGGSWRRRATLTHDGADEGDNLGASAAVSADGSVAVVGAVGDEDPNGEAAGAAYVFARSDGEWEQRARLAPADGDADDMFGSAVALSGDGTTAVVGAYYDEDPGGREAGSAYVFERSGGEWREAAKLVADDAEALGHVGHSVDCSRDGSTAVVGGFGSTETDSDDPGSAYVFDRTGGSWTQRARLRAADGDARDQFGFSVSMADDGATALVGAMWDADPNGEFAGSAYLLSRAGGAWAQDAKLVAADGDPEDMFGYAVGLSGDGTTAVVGARYDDDPNGEKSGAAYVFE